MTKASGTKVDRRKFLAGVAVAGATAAPVKTAKAAPTPANAGRLPAVLPPTAHEIAIETGAVHDRAMPPYSEHILSNNDPADIYAYVKSIPAGPDPKTIQLLNR